MGQGQSNNNRPSESPRRSTRATCEDYTPGRRHIYMFDPDTNRHDALAVVLGNPPAWAAQNILPPEQNTVPDHAVVSDPLNEAAVQVAPPSPRSAVSLQALASQVAAAANGSTSNPQAAPPRSMRATGASGGGAANPSSSSTTQRHKTTTLIPSWSRALSSQRLAIECQKVNHPARSSTAVFGTRECVAVLEMEVMKV